MSLELKKTVDGAPYIRSDSAKDIETIRQLCLSLREELAQQIENAVIEIAGDSAAAMAQAARIVRNEVKQ